MDKCDRFSYVPSVGPDSGGSAKCRTADRIRLVSRGEFTQGVTGRRLEVSYRTDNFLKIEAELTRYPIADLKKYLPFLDAKVDDFKIYC